MFKHLFFWIYVCSCFSLFFWTCTHSCIYLFTFVYIWLHRVLVAACGRSVEVVSGGNSLAVGHGLLTAVFLLLQSTGAGTQDSGAHQLRLGALGHGRSHHGAQPLVALWHVESSQIRDQTHVHCTGRLIFYPLCHQGSPV